MVLNASDIINMNDVIQQQQ